MNGESTRELFCFLAVKLHLMCQLMSTNEQSFLPCTYRALGDVYGLPKMHYKGKQGDFYIMVSTALCSLPPAQVAPFSVTS